MAFVAHDIPTGPTALNTRTVDHNTFACSITDATPDGCKTPEGVVKVNAALRIWEESHVDVANLAWIFMEEFGCRIVSTIPEAADAAILLQSAINDRFQKREAFLKVLEGR
jgi:hypothetical protein